MKFRKIGKIKDIDYRLAGEIATLLEPKGYYTERTITWAVENCEHKDCDLVIFEKKLRSIAKPWVKYEAVKDIIDEIESKNVEQSM